MTFIVSLHITTILSITDFVVLHICIHVCLFYLLFIFAHYTQLAASRELNARYEAEIEQHQLVVAECARLQGELEEAQRDKDKLSGSVNNNDTAIFYNN